MKTYNIFISHSWDYSDEYDRFVDLIKNRSYFDFRNHSVPKELPKDTSTDAELREALRRQISGTHVVIILAGMYVNYRKWIKEEIKIAQDMGKPMIGIIPWGQQRTPQEVQDAVKDMVGWNTESIINAIREHGL